MPDATGAAVLGLRERKKQRTRATLINAAVELCNRQGFERTTVDQIAAIADVSPRTFSRYFATKDAAVLAFVDNVCEMVAAELARQPVDISDLEALYRSYVQVFNDTKTASPNGLTADRLLASARVISSSPVLKHAVAAFRRDAVSAALAERMGVAPDDDRLKLLMAVWGAVKITALGDVGPGTDWDAMTVDEIVSLLKQAYGQFVDLTAQVRQPA